MSAEPDPDTARDQWHDVQAHDAHLEWHRQIQAENRHVGSNPATPCYICGSLPGKPTDSKLFCSRCGNQP